MVKQKKIRLRLLADGEIRNKDTFEYLGTITHQQTLEDLFHMKQFETTAFLRAYLVGENNGRL